MMEEVSESLFFGALVLHHRKMEGIENVDPLEAKQSFQRKKPYPHSIETVCPTSLILSLSLSLSRIVQGTVEITPLN